MCDSTVFLASYCHPLPAWIAFTIQKTYEFGAFHSVRKQAAQQMLAAHRLHNWKRFQ
jgi:hypothetical protein